MKVFWLRWLVNAAVLMLVANGINGPSAVPNARDDVFAVFGFMPALGAIVMVTLANALLRPLALLVTGMGCVANAVTLGLFGMVVSFVFYSLAFYLAGTLDLLGGFRVESFGVAMAGALWMAVANAFLAPLIDPKDKDRDERERERERRRS